MHLGPIDPTHVGARAGHSQGCHVQTAKDMHATHMRPRARMCFPEPLEHQHMRAASVSEPHMRQGIHLRYSFPTLVRLLTARAYTRTHHMHAHHMHAPHARARKGTQARRRSAVVDAAGHHRHRDVWRAAERAHVGCAGSGGADQRWRAACACARAWRTPCCSHGCVLLCLCLRPVLPMPTLCHPCPFVCVVCVHMYMCVLLCLPVNPSMSTYAS